MVMDEKKQLTTREAFAELISRRAWYKPLGITEGTASSVANRFREGKGVTIDKMEELLERAGFIVVQEKLWGE